MRNVGCDKAEFSRREFLVLLGAGTGAALLAGCSQGSGQVSTTETATGDGAVETENNAGSEVAGTETAGAGTAAGISSKVLVAYYSANGHTARAATFIADELGADLFGLVPAEPYSADDLDYNDGDSRVSREHADSTLQDVALEQATPEGWDGYETVLVGYPIWWGGAAWPTNRFVSGNDFTGKTVIPFCTSASSGLGSSGDDLAALAGTGDWRQGRRFQSSADEQEVRSWAAGLLS